MNAPFINGVTQLLGLMGDPVAHSLSPAMHNAALAHMGVNAVYLPLPVKSDRIGTALSGFSAISMQGINVTIPHKQTVLPFLDDISDTARQVGAVNTIYPLASGGWGGTNTDVSGFLHPLRQLERPWSQSVALILGSGGAARATVQGCLELGFGQVVVVGRSPERLVLLREAWPQLVTATWEDLTYWLPKTLLAVNATPIGMQSESDSNAVLQTPLSEEQLALLPDTAIAYDLVYVPRPTTFLNLADARGLATFDGLEMLVQQGAIALSLWFGGREVPIDVMRQAAKNHLGLH
ncbi:MAG: shikimate dehydrogenase [Cyanobacteria bacterium P01_E01_bin.34]